MVEVKSLKLLKSAGGLSMPSKPNRKPTAIGIRLIKIIAPIHLNLFLLKIRHESVNQLTPSPARRRLGSLKEFFGGIGCWEGCNVSIKIISKFTDEKGYHYIISVYGYLLRV